MKKTLVFILLLCLANSGKTGIDSLRQVLKNKKLTPGQQVATLKALSFDYCFDNPDSGMYYAREIYRLADKYDNNVFAAKADAMVATNYYMQLNYDSAIVYFERAIAFGEKNKNDDVLNSAYNNLGLVYLDRSEHALALNYLFKALEVRKRTNGKKQMAEAYDNIGLVYQNISDYTRALEYQFKALKIMEEIGDKKLISECYNNIAIVFDHNNKHKKALEFYFKSLQLIANPDDHRGLATSYVNIAITYNMLHMSRAALKYIRMSMREFEAVNDVSAMYGAYNNLGLVYLGANDSLKKEMHLSDAAMLDSALYYFEKRMSAPLFTLRSQANLFLNISDVYWLKKQYAKAKQYALKALGWARTSESKEVVVKVLDMLSSICNALHQDAEAYRYLKEYIKTRDEVFSIEKNNEITSRALNYQFEKKQLADSLLREKERQVARERISQQSTVIREKEFRMYLLYAVIVLVLVFSFFLYNRVQLIKKQKTTIEDQKLLVEEKQKEILDSINYAQRLQHAILARPQEIKKYFTDSFLLYKPKDIVAGDFYFFEVTGTHIFLAAADCTGHGVPGALVSVVCANALTRCVKEFKLTDPGLILDKTRELVLETFKKSGNDVKDGMDISLISVNLDVKNAFEISDNFKGGTLSERQTPNIQISWAGANNAFWYLEHGTMKELSPDKQPIGFSEHGRPFTTHKLQLAKGSGFFLFTDGYADQFGGPKGKKFKYSKLQELMIEISSYSMPEQGSRLETHFEKWKGNLEQVDDVCIIGVKL